MANQQSAFESRTSERDSLDAQLSTARSEIETVELKLRSADKAKAEAERASRRSQADVVDWEAR